MKGGGLVEKVQHLNYCRQMMRQFSAFLNGHLVSNIDFNHGWDINEGCGYAINLAGRSQKFLLPENGRILFDNEYKGLDEEDPLRLPFRHIALEYRHTLRDPALELEGPETGYTSSKRIIFAREEEGFIGITPVSYLDRFKTWQPYPECALPKTNYLSRNVVVNVQGTRYVGIHLGAQEGTRIEDYHYDARVLLGFLNALQCVNVEIVKSPAMQKK